MVALSKLTQFKRKSILELVELFGLIPEHVVRAEVYRFLSNKDCPVQLLPKLIALDLQCLCKRGGDKLPFESESLG